MTSNNDREIEDRLHELTWLKLVSNFFDNTGMHGLPNINRHRNIVRKLFWLIILLTGVGFMVYLVRESVLKFMSYPTETTVTPMITSQLEFPAVTFCNLNPVRYHQITSFGDMFSNFTSKVSTTVAPTSQSPNPDNVDTESYEEFIRFVHLYQSLNASTRISAGHHIDNMLLACYYNGPCTTSDFSHSLSALYGNCYTFNNGYNSSTVRSMSRVGPWNAFELLLYVEVDEYVEHLAQTAGIWFTIHNKSVPAFPEDEGFIVSPGAETYVGLTRKQHHLSPPPYGMCAEIGEEENKKKNIWATLDPLLPLNYTTLACKYTCNQRNIIKHCQCYDPNTPMNDLFNDLWVTPPTICSPDNATLYACLDDVYLAIENGSLGCNNKECPPVCQQISHQQRLSSGIWPNYYYEDEIQALLERKVPHLKSTLANMTVDKVSQYLRNNVLKIRIYFESFDYNLFETKPSYQLTQLLSDMGGQFGLWLGLSVITLFEFVELIWDIVFMIIFKYASKKETRVRAFQNTGVSRFDPDSMIGHL